jgi:histidyl-tRNA synthetase
VRLIDRKNKLPGDVFEESARELLGAERADNLRQVLSAQNFDELPRELAESDAARDVRELLELVRELGVETIRFDVTLMRGLEYYTGTVFEVFDTDPENNRSLFGGGRYDGLVGLFGVEPVSAVGFAPGLTTTELFLRSHNLLPDLKLGVDIYLASLGDTVRDTLRYAQTLRASGLHVEVDTTGRKTDKLFRAAEKKGATEIVFVGSNEVDSGVYMAKNLTTGETRTLS